MTIFTYMITVYAVLVRGGKYVLTAEDNKNNLQVVPEQYQTLVAEKLAAEKSA
ncbi:CD1375 family protein [Anaerosinus massiliensis]|uniref:CD1375 family protein n=1 Tax=Massilibacillus massiliensis TaxID=1806837 RepID=UPI000DA61D4C|nr:CD1375 family protein [Massilibacillus massiliensis]